MQVNNLNSLATRWHLSHGKVNALANVLAYSQAFVGDYKYSARQSDFEGWIKCDGRALDKERYRQLYEVIGDAFGETEGENEFLLPDFRGRVPATQGVQGILGDAVGSVTQTLTIDNMPNHNHTGTTSSDGLHTHTTNATGGTLGLAVSDGTNTVTETDPTSGELNVWTPPVGLTVNTDGSHTHAFTTSSVGGGAAFSVMQPTLFGGNMFIYSGVSLALGPGDEEPV
jgi:microcystin-dependent protein